MNPALKQRLVGAVLLVALAVIFLPMLLDGSGARERLDAEIAIPDKPEAPEPRLDQPEPALVSVPDTGERSERAVGDAQAVDATDDEQARAAAAAESGATATPDPVRESAPEPAAADRTDEGWIIQVGSFRRETNALVLRDRLRQQGYDAHSDRTESGGEIWWRVRLGPVAQRSEAESLQRRIEAARGSDTLLMAYP